jgi:prephenate dehydrogenase
MHVRSIGIIGYGQFGRFIESVVREHYPDIPVVIAGREDDGALKAACLADLVFLCVPIAAYADVARRIAPLLGPGSIVVDIATVKSHTVKVLKDAGIPRFISTHPMLGPYSYEKHGRSLAGLRIAVCDSTLRESEYARIVSWLRVLGLVVLELTPDEHDKLIAETLFLTHLIGQIVHKGGFERTSIDTVSFGYLMDAVESVAHDEALFRDVYEFDPYCEEVLSRVEAVGRRVADGLK